MNYYLTASTSNDVRSQEAEIAILPVGSFEQHGDFLPLVTDTIVAALIAKRVADDYNLFLLPPLTMACSHEHAGFPGTVSISASTIIALITDLRDSLKRQGVSKLVIINGHGGNFFLSNIVTQANVDGPQVALFPMREDWETARESSGCVSSHSDDMHAGELEVSLLLYADPALVRDGYNKADHLSYPRPLLFVTGMKGYTTSGVIGVPSEGSAEKGRAILDSLARSFADYLQALRQG